MTRNALFKGVELLVRLVLPPSHREHVLGDLRERHNSLLDYCLDAAFAIPCVITSQIRRSTDPAVLLMEAMILYVSLCAAAWFEAPAFLYQEKGLVRLAIPTGIALLAFVLIDAYSNPQRRWPLKPAVQTALAVGFAFLSEATFATNHQWNAPFRILLLGGGMSLLLISAIRMLFAAGDQRPTGSG